MLEDEICNQVRAAKAPRTNWRWSGILIKTSRKRIGVGTAHSPLKLKHPRTLLASHYDIRRWIRQFGTEIDADESVFYDNLNDTKPQVRAATARVG
jgi:hypothetical protein